MDNFQIKVSFPMSDDLFPIADYLEERGYREQADALRKRPKFEVGEIVYYDSNHYYDNNSNSTDSFLKISKVSLSGNHFLYQGKSLFEGGIEINESFCQKMTKREQDVIEGRFFEKEERARRFRESFSRGSIKTCRGCGWRVDTLQCNNCGAIVVARNLPNPPEITPEMLKQALDEGIAWSKAVAEGTKNLEGLP